MRLTERLTLGIAVSLLGALMIALGFILLGSQATTASNSMIGVELALIGVIILVFGLAYAIARPVNNTPDTPPRPYRVNDPNRVQDASYEARIIALQGWADGSVDNSMPSRSIKDKEK
jgi:hypothetical protein